MAIEVRQANDDQIVLQYSPLSRGVIYLLASLKEKNFIPLTNTGALKREYCHDLARAMRWRNYHGNMDEILQRIRKQSDYPALGLVRKKAVELGYTTETDKCIEVTERGMSQDLTACMIFNAAVHPEVVSAIAEAENAFARTNLPKVEVFLQSISDAGADGYAIQKLLNIVLQDARTPLQRSSSTSNVIRPKLFMPMVEYGLLTTAESRPVIPINATLRATPLFDLTVKISA